MYVCACVCVCIYALRAVADPAIHTYVYTYVWLYIAPMLLEPSAPLTYADVCWSPEHFGWQLPLTAPLLV